MIIAPIQEISFDVDYDECKLPYEVEFKEYINSNVKVQIKDPVVIDKFENNNYTIQHICNYCKQFLSQNLLYVPVCMLSKMDEKVQINVLGFSTYSEIPTADSVTLMISKVAPNENSTNNRLIVYTTILQEYVAFKKTLEFAHITDNCLLEIKFKKYNITLQATCVGTETNTRKNASAWSTIYRIELSTNILLMPPLNRLDTPLLKTQESSKSIKSELMRRTNYEELSERIFLSLLYFKYRDSEFLIKPSCTFVLHGPSGSGKSTTIQQILDGIQNNWKNYCKSFFDNEVLRRPKTVLLNATTIGGSDCSSITKIINFDMTDDIPTIYFLDDIEIMLRKFSHDWYKRTTFLFEALSRCESKENRQFIIVFIVEEITRVMPFIKKSLTPVVIEATGLTVEERTNLLGSILQESKHDISKSQIKEFALTCQGYSVHDLVQVCRGGSLLGIRRHLALADNTIDSFKLCIDDLRRFKKKMKPSNMEKLAVEVPTVKWEDIGGYEKVKKLLKESVEWPITYNELFRKLNLKPPTGILLYGPPGCSKTLLAKAVATESHMNFLSVKGPEIYSKWVGESEKNVRNLFYTARINAPCIIFFDEFDSIASSRTKARSSSVDDRVLCQLLSEMDGVEENNTVIIIGATNSPEAIDAAAIRPGRLDRLIHVPLPDLACRKKIFQVHLRDIVTFNSDNKADNRTVFTEEDLDVLGEMSLGLSGAEIAFVCKEVTMQIVRNAISQNIIETESLNVNIKLDQIIKTIQTTPPRTDHSLLRKYDDFAATH